MAEVYVVSSTHNKIETENREELNIATGAELSEIIAANEREVLGILSNDKTTDPSLKQCSRCKKMGRVGLYPLDQFSIVAATGKPHSQCKVCRTEQAKKWTHKDAAQIEKRKAYQKAYRAKNAETLKIQAQARQYRKEQAALNPEPEVENTKRDDVLFIMGKSDV